ncbi:sensor histidine kinase [Streptomyces sp. NBC_00320]|uniref:sensor histidine kinase n=1 Tax=Streptomyces sp. NBC_00320 TaxID=2975711 RepID=UPI0022591E9F|nr:sensor histidine kinase [Streptomyces sp. NBC_00320]MCX5147127.1 sensor histidine kinase [Streptomyces sp. NBC_00320]
MNTSSGQTDRGRPAVRWQTAALWAGAGLGTLALSNLAFRVPLGVGDRIFAVGPLLAVIGVATGALLVRRAPLSTLALMLLGTYLMLFLGRAPALTLAMVLPAAVALGMVAATRSRRVTLSAVGITVLLLLTAQFALPVTGPARILTQSQLPIVVLAWLMGDSVRRAREAAAQAQARATEQALTDERLRIARELHDMVAHSIGVIAIQAGVGSRVIETQPTQAREALRAIEATSRETLAALRRTLVALRRSDPASVAPTPGLDGIERLAATTASDTGVRVDVVWAGERRPLPADIELAAFRIVQEALTNVVRHAHADGCRVGIAYGHRELALEITDDGRGILQDGAAGAGFGITGMRERTALLNGRFEAGPRAEGGFRVAAVLPVEQPEQPERPEQPVVRDREEKR